MAVQHVKSTSNYPPSFTSEQLLPGLVQAPFESKYHWLCRRKFIEDHKTRYSLERAISLSMTWSNINFLGCKYSDRITELVSYYPVPEENEITRWLDAHPDILQERHCSSIKISGKRTLRESSPQATAELDHFSPPPPLKQPKTEGPSVSRDVLHHEQSTKSELTEQVDSFIAMIRQKEGGDYAGKSSDNKNNNSNNNIDCHHSARYKLIQLLASTNCKEHMVNNDINPCSYLQSLLDKHNLEYQFKFFNGNGAQSEYIVEFYINGCLMLTNTGSVKKIMKKELCQVFLKEIMSCQ